MIVRDSAGTELKPALLQILDKDADGPILLRARRPHETIELTDERRRSFLVVWAPVDQSLGEVQLNQLYEDFEALKESHEQAKAAKAQIARDIENIERDVKGLEAENKGLVESLRQLHKERDPSRLDAMVKDAVEKRTAALTAELAKARADIAERDREIAELKASKKKLKEANERLKEGRK